MTNNKDDTVITNGTRDPLYDEESSQEESFYLVNKHDENDKDIINQHKNQENNTKYTTITLASNDAHSFKQQEKIGEQPCGEEELDGNQSNTSSSGEEDDDADESYDSSSMEEDEESSSSSMEDDTNVPNHVPREITMISHTTTGIEDEKKEDSTEEEEESNATLDKNSDPIMPGYTDQVFISKKTKEIFCQFAKVLVKYLQMVFPSLYLRAKHIIRKCDEFKRENKPGFEILAFSIQFNLRRLVGKQIWKKTEEYHIKWLLQHFMTNNTFSTEAEAKMEARRIAHIGHQPLVHPSKLQGYRGKKSKVNEPAAKHESEMKTDHESNDDDDEMDSILKDYVIVGKMEALNITS
ncbi:hypothetical protein CTEN210_13296 [Chaetoceros tenuissimus]|uniref:Uncharacterized protein n=1 Tax=Chaetoceros tenuissimus TaxID=426638 RepID=A0AAD3D4Y8_9STRA|nr:hypothetical protein CTEN210_13296 [Chaetoceros tenuissimus]